MATTTCDCSEAEARYAALEAMLAARGVQPAPGADLSDSAFDWDDHEFTIEAATAWCDAGVWCAYTANSLRGAGWTPETVATLDRKHLAAVCRGDVDVETLVRVRP